MEREYLEFELDGETMEQIEILAREENVTPFKMCVILLEEAVREEENRSSPGQDS